MIPIVTPDTMRALEQQVMDTSVTELDLIQRAATQIANYLDRSISSKGMNPRSLLAVAGPGNNGVDALVAAAMLASRGWEVYALLVDRKGLSELPLSDDLVSGIQLVTEVPEVDVILDGIFGNSGRIDLPDTVTSALEKIAEAIRSNSPPLVVAVDCPTGTNTLTGEVASSILSADVTLCISNPKIGMLRTPAIEHLGQLEVLDIGIRTADVDPEVRAAIIDAGHVRSNLVSRSVGAHKSQVGGLLIVGGAPGYYGAPRLAGEAALRAGCGYVGLAIPRSIVGAIASAVPELIFHPTSDSDGRRSATTVREALSKSSRYDAIVIGPGLGRDEVASALLSELFDSHAGAAIEAAPSSAFGIPRRTARPEAENETNLSAYPLVLDADALNWLSEQDDWPSLLQGKTCVLTPHVGEMARLLGVEPEDVSSDPWTVARTAAADWGQVVVLKSQLTCVAKPEGDVVVAPRPTPELATPGTGDVLSGLIGAFIAQGSAVADGAAIALYVGAMSGKMALTKHGARSVIARDVIDGVSRVLRDLESPTRARLAAA
ncbi:bifunctional ADP-dependent NAD(P)H-hydrate dehydratase/NAD(P)H-hydrate epimerase [soil metagenome]